MFGFIQAALSSDLFLRGEEKCIAGISFMTTLARFLKPSHCICTGSISVIMSD